MKHHIVEPRAKSSTDESQRAQQPKKMKDLVEDPLAEARDMSAEQSAAFVPPAHEEKRVLRSQGDQGRT